MIVVAFVVVSLAVATVAFPLARWADADDGRINHSAWIKERRTQVRIEGPK